MAKIKECDIIDKLFDRFVNGPRFQDVTMSIPLTETTYVGTKAIAKRLGCSLSTVQRLIALETILVFKRYKNGAYQWATNETLIRETFILWCHSARIAVMGGKRLREGKAPLPDSGTAAR